MIEKPIVIPPTKATLKKYGLTIQLWQKMLNIQQGRCYICDREFSEKVKPCVDHLHVRNYKKFSPEKKRIYVRGLLCRFCNRQLVPKGMTTERAKNVYLYLQRFDSMLYAAQNTH